MEQSSSISNEKSCGDGVFKSAKEIGFVSLLDQDLVIDGSNYACSCDNCNHCNDDGDDDDL